MEILDESVPMDIRDNEAGEAPSTSGASSLCDAGGGAVHNIGRIGAILAYRAFEILESAFTPMPTTPDRQHLSTRIRGLSGIDRRLTRHLAYPTSSAMDPETNNMRRLGASKTYLVQKTVISVGVDDSRVVQRLARPY